MNRVKLLSLIDALNLPKGEWVVFGGACLTAHGIRETTDLELFVTARLYDELKSGGWEERVTGSTGARYVMKVHENIPVLAFITCGSDQWRPQVEKYLQKPEAISGIPCMPLTEMYSWKAATARPKDLSDLVLMDDYFGGL